MAALPAPRVRERDRDREGREQLRRVAGRWLKAQREAAGLTQADLAEALGLRYYTFVSQVEGGHGRVPSDQIMAWAQALRHDPRAFGRVLLRHYDPDLSAVLFPEDVTAALLPDALADQPIGHAEPRRA